jgi:hypothetical protein
LGSIRRPLSLALIGVSPEDSDDVRVQKVTLTLSAVTVTVLAVFWVGTYLALGLALSAAIPFAYEVASVVTLVAFASTGDYRFFRFSQIVLIFLLPLRDRVQAVIFAYETGLNRRPLEQVSPRRRATPTS